MGLRKAAWRQSPSRPYSNCNVLVLNQQGQSRLAARWRFFYNYDWAIVWLCVATFVGLQIARLGGWIGRNDKDWV
jgi:hypothetical protein